MNLFLIIFGFGARPDKNTSMSTLNFYLLTVSLEYMLISLTTKLSKVVFIKVKTQYTFYMRHFIPHAFNSVTIFGPRFVSTVGLSNHRAKLLGTGLGSKSCPGTIS